MSASSPLADPDRRDPDAVPVPIMLQAAVVALTGGTDSDASGLRLPRKSARRGHEVLRRGCGVAGLTSQDDGAFAPCSERVLVGKKRRRRTPSAVARRIWLCSSMT